MIFIDTSAFYALADKADDNHEKAKTAFAEILASGEELFTHNYIIIETAALLQRRLGLASVTTFLREVLTFRIRWIDAAAHKISFQYFLRYGKRNLSFVDCVSFAVMKDEDARVAFAFDNDFKKFGFILYS